MTIKGIGGPCPACKAEQCYVERSTGRGWNTIGCVDCLFAFQAYYGGTEFDMSHVAGGITVWDRIIDEIEPASIPEINESIQQDIEQSNLLDSPFDSKNFSKTQKKLAMTKPHVFQKYIDARTDVDGWYSDDPVWDYTLSSSE